jgi:hypothetical protein
VCISNPDCSSFKMQSQDLAQTPSVFLEILFSVVCRFASRTRNAPDVPSIFNGKQSFLRARFVRLRNRCLLGLP